MITFQEFLSENISTGSFKEDATRLNKSLSHFNRSSMKSTSDIEDSIYRSLKLYNILPDFNFSSEIKEDFNKIRNKVYNTPDDKSMKVERKNKINIIQYYSRNVSPGWAWIEYTIVGDYNNKTKGGKIKWKVKIEVKHKD